MIQKQLQMIIVPSLSPEQEEQRLSRYMFQNCTAHCGGPIN